MPKAKSQVNKENEAEAKTKETEAYKLEEGKEDSGEESEESEEEEEEKAEGATVNKSINFFLIFKEKRSELFNKTKQKKRVKF
jgi:hypothetical protein